MAHSQILSILNLSATFPNGNGGLEALREISFSVNTEEFVCILGPSGSGKSTLLRILAGLLQPTQGEVMYSGQDPQKDLPRTGVVFQKANLMPWRTVIENILLPLELNHMDKKDAGEKAEILIKTIGLQGFEYNHPHDLSGGMEQRVAIARALISNPDILLLDEPFGSLDAFTRERMGEELLRIWQTFRKTVIMVTHSIPEAIYLADRVIVLSSRPGRIRLDLPIDFPRPRGDQVRYTAQFGEYAEKIRSVIAIDG